MTRLRQAGTAALALCALLGLRVSPALAQERPLGRSFSVGESVRYRIQLVVQTEVAGQQTETIGAKTYVRPFSRTAETALSWVATRRVLAVDASGTAEVEETLDHFGSLAHVSTSADQEAEKLSGAQREALAGWKVMRSLRYHETRAGQLLDLKTDGVPSLGEAPPTLLTLWLLRALRPAAALPGTSIHFDHPWQEPRTAQLPGWAEVRGSENGEWLEAREAFEPAVRLHVVQQISGTVVSGAEKPPEGTAQGRFHGESLNTVSLGDARLLAARRSATREITWTLVPVEGLPERPQFRGRLSVQVQIEACNEDPCLFPGLGAGRSRE